MTKAKYDLSSIFYIFLSIIFQFAPISTKMSSTYGEPMAAIMVQFAKMVIMETHVTSVHNSITQKTALIKKLILSLEKELCA